MIKRLTKTPIALMVASTLTISAQAADLVLEEVVVTAQKRSESLQDTPISISAFSESALENYDIKQVNDISKQTPNVQFRSSAGGAGDNVLLNIRGVGEPDPAITRDLTVGMYLDGVFIGRSAGAAFDIVDLERVEVLRGPQGTLYGKNTTGGAVNFVTAQPTGELGLKQTFTVGNYNTFESRTSANLPSVGETGEGLGKLSAKLSYNYAKRDGLYEGAEGSSTSDYDNKDDQSARVALLWELTDDTQVQYSYDYTDNAHVGRPQAFNTTPGEAVDRPDEDVMTVNAKDSTLGVKGQALVISHDSYDLPILGDVTFKSLTGYRDQSQEEHGDYSADGSFYASSITDVEQFSQELQMVGNSLDSRLDYAVGLYYFNEQGDYDGTQTVVGNSSFTGDYNLATRSFYGMDNTSYAAYGQATYTPSFLEERMRITAGLRYTRDDKDQYLEIERNSQFQTEIPPFAVNGLSTLMPHTNAEETFTKTTPTVTVDYSWTDALSTYAKVSTGFRSGGFNVRAATPEEFQTAFDPEEMLSYELGMKSDWFDRRVRLNTAIYYNDYDDLQVVNSEYSDELRLMGGTITNAGKASYYGGEIEFSAVLTEDLVLNAGYGYTKIDYKEYNKTDTATGVTEDIAEYLDNGTTPEHTFNVSLDYTIADFDFGTLRAFADANWQDNMEMTNDTRKQDTSLSQDAYWLVNGRVVLSDVPMPAGDLRLALWGKNLTDEEYIVHSIDYGSLGYQGAVFGDPRTYGLDVTYTY